MTSLIPSPRANAHVACQLIDMYRADQDSLTKSGVMDTELHLKNSETLKTIIQNIGWPSILVVGEEASQAAWLIAQHADHDLEFQKSCLELMKKAPENSVRISHMAYLEDRILKNSNQPQIYGTQSDPDGSGKSVLWPLQYPANVNQRRTSVGLPTMEEYHDGFADESF